MTSTPTRIIVLALLAAACLGLTAPQHAAASSRPGPVTLRLGQPGAGHITVAEISETFTGRERIGLPARLHVSFRGAASMPASERVLFASHSVKTARSTILALLVLVVHAASPGAKSAATSTPAGHDATARLPAVETFADGISQFFAAGLSDYSCRGTCRGHAHPTDRCHWCHGEQVVNADDATSATLKDLFAGVRQGGWEPSVFSSPDPSLETGHYDDGHAFGWKPQGETSAWRDLTNAAVTQTGFDQFVAQLEADLGADINGDGTVGPGASSNTTVGPPTVSGGGQ